MAKLSFYYGTMFSGKTTELIKQYDNYKHRGVEVAVIKPMVDDRNGLVKGWTKLSSRITKLNIPVYSFDNIIDVTNNIKFDVLLVDEAQFLSRTDVEELIKYVDKYNINVICYGLKTDISGNLFSGSRELLKYSDEIIEMKTLCQKEGCNNNAILHARYINGNFDTNPTPRIIEKGNITYKVLCRKHWQEERQLTRND